ncbi:MAG: FAD-binding oxidoreductase [Negativicutes bacterium]|nr:FAD-binding oxidoreductase [Negativicutes bacterium]
MNNLIKPLNEQYAEYLRDESRTVGQADSISFPVSEAEILSILAYLYQSATPLTIQGARTGLAAAAVPLRGHVMNLSRMNRVIGCRRDESGRFYFTVQPGLVLSEFKKMIKKKQFASSGWDTAALQAYEDFGKAPRQFFAPDPTEASATIGGMTACNASGARTFLYGPIRHHISALRMLLSDGRMIALRRGEVFARGRRLSLPLTNQETLELNLPTYRMPQTKSASGYYIEDNMDAIDLLIGSDGTLGVITAIELALMEHPRLIWGVSCFFADEDQAVQFTMRLRSQVQHLAALEAFDADALELLRQQKRLSSAFARLPEVPESYRYCIYTELHCQDAAEALAQLRQIGAVLQQSGGNKADTWVARTEADLTQLQFFRHAVPESANLLIDRRKQNYPMITKLGTDMSVPDDQLAQVVALYRRGLRENQLQSAIWGHIGNNHLHVNILPRNEADFWKGKALYQQWAAQICQMGGAVAAEHGVGKLKTKMLLTMYGAEHIAEMAALKKVFDPRNLLGNGNLFEADGGEKV